MKYLTSKVMIVAAIVAIAFTSCKTKQAEQEAEETDNGAPITENLRFCESVLPYNDGLLIANFGTKTLDADNTGLGFITLYKNGRNELFIPADGNLTQPRGMGLFQDHLFVACLNSIVVYDLNDLSDEPQTILFPEDDLIVNDIAINNGGTLFASVSNTGRVYILNIQNPENIDVNSLMRYVEIPGANGLVLDGRHLYIASYNPTGDATEENVLYVLDDVSNPLDIRHLTGIPGQYDGLALSPDGTLLFFTDWSNGGRVGYIRFENGEITYLPSDGIVGPADLCVWNHDLCVPDLVNSTVVRFLLEE